MRNRALRLVAVLGLCLGLAATSLAAKSGSAPDPAAAVVAAARSHLGQPYQWGAAGPDAFDCSGLIYLLWRQSGSVAGVPRVSVQQQAWAVPIPIEQVLPGDLVFFGNPATHVGLVTSRTGTAVRMIDAASSRRGVVERDVWTTEVVRYGRVPRPGMPAVRPWTGPVPVPAAPVTAPLTLPAPTQTVPSSPVATRAAALARRSVGAVHTGDAAFLRRVWLAAGGAALPSDRNQLVALGRGVALADARIGDLVVYGQPGAHVGLYVGNGLMVDDSRRLGKVVLRAVWASSTLRLVRLPV